MIVGCGGRRGAALLVFVSALVLLARVAAAQFSPPSRTSLEVPDRVRLLVVAPHPDDETLGAAGLMQRVQGRQGQVSVAYLTSGDGYVDGVELETHRLKPGPRDFVDYGERRLREALRALQALSIREKRLFACGFPDGGLFDLLTTSWSSTTPFVSPYTHDDRPPYALSVTRGAAYSGVALERELARLIVRLNPQWIAVTGPWDVHPDHCASFHFVVRALRRLSASNPDFTAPQLLAYTVHRPDWPGSAEGAELQAPPGVSPLGASWQFLELSAAELDGKGRALDEYTSQMEIMAVLFRAFVRSDEVFAVYPSLPAGPAEACGRALPAPVEAHRASR
jgi:LmbE family N-acetylglucosaminyl deacetylase